MGGDRDSSIFPKDLSLIRLSFFWETVVDLRGGLHLMPVANIHAFQVRYGGMVGAGFPRPYSNDAVGYELS